MAKHGRQTPVEKGWIPEKNLSILWKMFFPLAGSLLLIFWTTQIFCRKHWVCCRTYLTRTCKDKAGNLACLTPKSAILSCLVESALPYQVGKIRTCTHASEGWNVPRLAACPGPYPSQVSLSPSRGIFWSVWAYCIDIAINTSTPTTTPQTVGE